MTWNIFVVTKDFGFEIQDSEKYRTNVSEQKMLVIINVSVQKLLIWKFMPHDQSQ